jgi:hypothetical protein
MIAPADARIFSAQSFAFATGNESAAIALLGRSEADGGGQTGYNMALAPGAKVRGWFGIDGQNLDADASADTPHFRSRGVSLQGGLDTSIGETGRIGAALGYHESNFRDGAGSTGGNDAVQASLYASQPIGPIGLSAVLSYAHSWNTSHRETGIGRAKAKYDLSQVMAGVQAVAPFKVGGVTVTPAVGVLASRLSGDAFRETGDVLAAFRVSGDFEARSFVSPYATLQVSYPWTSSNGVTWIPDFELGYRYGDAARGNAVTLVADDGSVFNGNRVELNKGSVLVGASLSGHKGGWTGALQYRGKIADGWADHAATVAFRYAF